MSVPKQTARPWAEPRAVWSVQDSAQRKCHKPSPNGQDENGVLNDWPQHCFRYPNAFLDVIKLPACMLSMGSMSTTKNFNDFFSLAIRFNKLPHTSETKSAPKTSTTTTRTDTKSCPLRYSTNKNTTRKSALPSTVERTSGEALHVNRALLVATFSWSTARSVTLVWLLTALSFRKLVRLLFPLPLPGFEESSEAGELLFPLDGRGTGAGGARGGQGAAHFTELATA